MLQLDALLHPRLPYRMREVVWSARHEMARTTEDVLARRTRALFLDARAAIEAAPAVAALLATELKRSNDWMEKDLANFIEVAKSVYLPGRVRLRAAYFEYVIAMRKCRIGNCN